MIRCVLITNRAGNLLLERYHGVPPDERGQWRAFLVRLGNENLPSGKEEEQFIASYRNVFAVYTYVGEICLYVVGGDEYDELGCAEVVHTIVTALRDTCSKKGITENNFLDRYGKVCLALDEIVAQGIYEHSDKDRIRRLGKLKPLEGF
eukprot:jgi/Mesen1/7302/ME000374S06658